MALRVVRLTKVDNFVRDIPSIASIVKVAELDNVDYILYPSFMRLGKKDGEENQKYACPLLPLEEKIQCLLF